MSAIQLVRDLNIILPELFLAIASLFSLVLGSIFNKSEKLVGYVIVLFLISLIYFIHLNQDIMEGIAFNNSYFNNGFLLFLKSAILGGLVVIILGYLSVSKKVSMDFIFLALFAIIGSMLAISSKNLLMLFLGLELQSLPSYIMAGFLRDKLKSSEAGLKYFVLGAVSSSILLFGASLVYGFTGHISYEAIHESLSASSNIAVIVGISMILVSMFFKMSAAPFHIWSPDVYEGAPMVSVSIFSSIHKIAIAAIFVIFLSKVLGELSISFIWIFKMLAILSLMIGAFGGLMQKSLKRLMAYSAILNAGYVLLAVISDISLEMFRSIFLAYIIIYSVGIIAFFTILNNIFQEKSDDLLIKDLAGLSINNKLYSLALVLILSSMIGLPPLAGFFAKYYVLYNLVNIQEYALAIIAIISSVVAAFYYLRVIKAIYFDEAKQAKGKTAKPITVLLVTFTSLFFLICFALYFNSYFYQMKIIV